MDYRMDADNVEDDIDSEKKLELVEKIQTFASTSKKKEKNNQSESNLELIKDLYEKHVSTSIDPKFKQMRLEDLNTQIYGIKQHEIANKKKKKEIDLFVEVCSNRRLLSTNFKDYTGVEAKKLDLVRISEDNHNNNCLHIYENFYNISPDPFNPTNICPAFECSHRFENTQEINGHLNEHGDAKCRYCQGKELPNVANRIRIDTFKNVKQFLDHLSKAHRLDFYCGTHEIHLTANQYDSHSGRKRQSGKCFDIKQRYFVKLFIDDKNQLPCGCLNVCATFNKSINQLANYELMLLCSKSVLPITAQQSENDAAYTFFCMCVREELGVEEIPKCVENLYKGRAKTGIE